MLDVHTPHHALQGWRSFFAHIATITVGLLIALGLEQTAEHFHHRAQVEEMRESLRQEGLDTQTIVSENSRAIDATIAKIDRSIDRIQASERVEHPDEVILAIPSDSAWAAARDSGLLSLAPRTLVDNYWKVYYLQEAAVIQIRTTYVELDNLNAMFRIHPDTAVLSPAERETMLMSFARYREKLKILKLDLSLLGKVEKLAAQDRKIDAAAIYK